MTEPRTPDVIPLDAWKRCTCGGKVKSFLIWVRTDWRRFWFCDTCRNRRTGTDFPE